MGATGAMGAMGATDITIDWFSARLHNKRDMVSGICKREAGAGVRCGSRDVMWRTMSLRPWRQFRERQLSLQRRRLPQNVCGLESALLAAS